VEKAAEQRTKPVPVFSAKEILLIINRLVMSHHHLSSALLIERFALTLILRVLQLDYFDVVYTTVSSLL